MIPLCVLYGYSHRGRFQRWKGRYVFCEEVDVSRDLKCKDECCVI